MVVSKVRKRKVLCYYVLSKLCVCGSPKIPNRWLCIPCRDKMVGSPQAKILDDACQKHIVAALNYLSPCRKRKVRVL